MAIKSNKNNEEDETVAFTTGPSQRPQAASSASNNDLTVTRINSHQKHQKDFALKGIVTILIVVALLFVTNSLEIRRVERNGDADDASNHHAGMNGVIQIKSTTVKNNNRNTNVLSHSDVSSPSQDTTVNPELKMEMESRSTYQLRGQPLTDDEQKEMIQTWGSWTLIDTKRDQRPQDDYYATYTNRDIPRSEFPPNAWQLDKEYLDEFLPHALALVDRAQQAILAEYGKGPDSNMFLVDIMDTWENQDLNDVTTKQQGGFTNRKSWNGFVRRILHAIMTEDSFVFAMGGHSAAAAHGNHFTQSYTIQVQWILEAVFARLGIRHESRNFGMGGLGTVHNGLGAGSVYGPDVDMLMWDSSMTEKGASAQDLLHRQYILGGQKVPILWSLSLKTIQHLHLNADVDVGMPGEGMDGIPKATTMEELNAQPWATRYIKCTSELKTICHDHEYSGTCWIERDDFEPNTTQNNAPGGRASWHPGNRKHQLRGRVLAYTILSALRDALTLWKDAEGYVLSDEVWHVTDYYNTIRAKVAADTEGACHDKFSDAHLGFACKYPVKSRTEFTPRAYPPWTNIRDLMPPQQRATVNSSPPNIYEPPDVFNPHLHPPKGSVDVLNIVEQGVPFQSVLKPDYTGFYSMPSFAEGPRLPIGFGVYLNTRAGDSFCDGSATSFCSRGADSGCLLYGHNDGRNGLAFDGYSGWVIVNIPDVKNGYIAVMYHSWHKADGNEATEGWNSINNERQRRLGAGLESRTDDSIPNNRTYQRVLKNKPAPFCDDFVFEYAIDGKVNSLNLTEWKERSQKVQRVVEIMTLLEDPAYTGGKEKEVEIAVRIRGCARAKHFFLTHVYWS